MAGTDDFTGVKATFDKPSYNAGDKMTVSITGSAVQPGTSTETVQVTVSLLASDGSTGSVVVSVPVSKTSPLSESVTIASVSDSDGRVWTVAASKLSATATA